MNWELPAPKLPNDPVGDAMLIPKERGTTRLHFQNINGTSVRLGGAWTQHCEHWKTMQVDLVMACEHKLDTTHRAVEKKMVADAAAVYEKRHTFDIQVNSSPINSGSQRKPGGVLQMVRGPMKGAIQSTHKDKYGRWVSHTFKRVGQGPVTIITTYQAVNTAPKSAGPTTYITQLYSQYYEEGRSDPHKIRQHHATDLTRYIQNLQTQQHSIVLAGDFNEALADAEGRGMSYLCNQCSLVDPILNKFGITEFTTYNRGTKVIDYILISQDLLGAVSRCGYEAYQSNIISDHRGVYMDVFTNVFFGDSIPKLKDNSRDVVSTKVHQVEPYFTVKGEQLEHHKWFEQIPLIQKAMADNTPNGDLADKLYDRLNQASLCSANKLPKYRQAPYSPELVKLRNIKNFLRTLYTQYTTHYDMTEELEETKSKLFEMEYPIPPNPEDCKKAISKADAEFRKALREELQKRPKRQAHLEACIETARALGQTKKVKALIQIKRAEELSGLYRKLRAVRGLKKGSGLSHLLVPGDTSVHPNDCNEWRVEDVPEAIEVLLEERNRQHFGQSKDCNLTSEPTDFTMDFTGACHRAEAILNGTYPTDHLDEFTRILLEAFQYKDQDQPEVIEPTITRQDFLGKIKAWSEKTTTSPGTKVHLGHLKMYLAQHGLDLQNPKEASRAQQLEDTRDKIINGHVALLQYAIHFGHSYHPWKTIVNAMLEKKAGEPKLHRLRVIHLYEADYNLILCVKWRQLLQHAVDKGYVNESQFGSQPGKEALDAVFIREMEYDLIRLTRKPTIHFDNDATSCYDRIPCFLGNVASRKYGMSRMVCIVQGRTLEEARYHLKTIKGISERFVQHSRAYPWFGNGQGAGDSPGKWLFICSTLFDEYEELAIGSTYESPNRSLSVTIYAVGFVDDVRNTTNQFTRDEPPTMEDLIHQATADSQLWHDLLQASNQKLELTKCGFHAIQYTFKPDGQPVLESKPQVPPLVVKDDQGTSTAITQWKNDEAQRYLGCWESPSGKKEQLKVLHTKCTDFVRIVNSCYLTKREASLLYHAIYRLSVGFALPMTHSTYAQLNKLHRPPERAFIRKMGYCMNTAIAVIRGPQHLGGVGLFHLYDDQSLGEVKFFLKFWRSPGCKPGKLLRIVMAWVQLCCGVSWFVLERPDIPLQHLEAKWIGSLLEYLNCIKATIQVFNPPIAPRQRENDVFIMDIVVQSGKFKPVEIKRVNYCRMYLNVILLSDICLAGGHAIDPAMYYGKFEETVSKHKDHRVNQQYPVEPKAWEAWRKALHFFCHARGRMHLKLSRFVLGDWLFPWKELRREWPLLFEPDEDVVYRSTSEGWTRHKKLYSDFDQDPADTISEPPLTAVPCDIRFRGTWTMQLDNYQNLQPPQSEPLPASSIHEVIETLDKWEKDLLQDLEFLVPETDVWEAMEAEHCIFVSDGSAPAPKGSFGWVLSTPNGRRLARCSGPAYGLKPNSYRAEGYGMLSVHRFEYRMNEVHDGTIKRPELDCDSESMINTCKKYRGYKTIFPNNTLSAEWDIVAEILATLNLLPRSAHPKLEHIKGHQDDHVAYNKLSLRAQLNVDADALAEQWLADHPDWDHSRVPVLPTSGSQLNLPEGTVTHKLKQELYLARNEPIMKQHMMKKYQWDESTYHDVDWTSHGRALARLSRHRMKLVKYLNNISPCGKVAHRNNPKYPEDCPSCGALVEDQHHLIHCPKRKDQRELWYKAIKQHTDDKKTPLPLQELLLQALRAILDQQSTDEIVGDQYTSEIAAAQKLIGWDQILKGRFSKKWAEFMDQHLGSEWTQKNSGTTWMTGLIQTMLQQWIDLWSVRNLDRHGGDYKAKADAQKRQAIREVTMMYEQYQGNVGPHEWIFQQTPLLQRIQQSTTAMRQWINTWQPILESYQTQLETG